jgi:sugar diacid utilization regulator
LEMQKILDRLGEAFPLREAAATPGPTYIQTHKMIKPGQSRFFPACLYAGYTSELPPALEEGSSANLICIQDGEVPPGLLKSEGLNLYLAQRGTNQFDILNRIADIMIDEATVTYAMRRILDALYTGVGIQGLVDVACEVFENPLFINDQAYKIIAMSHTTTFQNQSLEAEKALGYVHLENIESMRRDGVIANKGRKEGAVYFSRRSDKNECWLFSDVRLHGITIASIAIVDANRPFRELDYELLERFTKIVAVELEKNDFYKDNRGMMYNYLLSDLLSGKLQDRRTIEQRANILRWKMYRWFLVMVVGEGRSDYSESRLQSVADNLRRSIPDCHWTIHQRNLVVFLSRPEKRLLTQGEEALLEQFFADNGLFAGVSEPFEELADAARHYRQAIRAADVGAFLGRDTLLYRYGEMMPYYAAQLLLKRNQLRDFCPEEVRVLQAYDERNGSRLVRTLERYLLHVDDPVTAAKELCIHRNTLLYRLGKIRELTGCDLNNGELRLKIQLYLKLAEWQGRQGG